MTTKKTLRAAGAALVAAGIALGAVTPAIAAPSSGANWDGDNRGSVISASIADADRARLAEVGLNLESIEIVQRAASTHDIELNWDVDKSKPFPEALTPILDPDRADTVDIATDPWSGSASSMMLGVKGQNIYEPGKYPSGSPAGTFSRNIPLDFVANTPERSPAKMSAASLSSWRPGSADAQPAVESWNIDKYQTLSPEREAATEAAGL